jgi:hypothetical protein
MKIEYDSVIGAPVADLNSQCLQCCFRDISGPDTCLPYHSYECHPDIQFKKSKCEVFKL